MHPNTHRFPIVWGWVVILFLQAGLLSAAVPPSHFSAHLWQSVEGLPHNNITALLQTRTGYLFVGTGAGLARFDGTKFTTVDLPPILQADNPSISALCESKDGSLWVGTTKVGLLRFHAGNWTRYTRTNGLAGDSVRTLLAARDGSVWVGTLTGLGRWKNGQFSSFDETQGLTNKIVRCLHEDAEGTLWIGAGYGINTFQNEVLRPFTFSPGEIPPVNSIKAISRGPDGTLWVGFTAGLAGIKGDAVTYYRKQEGLVDNTVSALTHDRTGNLWIGTFGGLNRSFTGQLRAEVNSSGGSYDQVNAIMEDKEGNIWLGAREGLYRLTQKPFVTYNRQHGLSHNNVMSIFENKPGHYWIGTWGGGLNWMHDGIVTQYSSSTATNNGLTSDLILGLHMEKKGHLWLGTDHLGGLFQLNFGKFNRYWSRQGLTNPAVRVIYQDTNLNFWLGTSSALVRFRGGKFDSFTTAEGLAGDAVRAIIPDPDGALWIGTETGLSRMEDGQFKNLTMAEGLSDNAILALYLDKEKTLWIGTRSGGLNKLTHKADGSGFNIQSYTTRRGLFSDEVLDILEDDNNCLWMSSQRGVFRIGKRELAQFDAGRIGRLDCKAFGTQDGMLSVQCNGVAKPGAIKANDGRLWFATIKGAAVVDPNFHRTNQISPPIFIESVFADQKQTFELNSLGGRTNDASKSAPSTKASFDGIVVQPGRGQLEFFYTALSFSEPERVQFRYKLEGIDSDWVEAGSRRSARYNNILPGDYWFQVKASNNDGLWNESGDSISIRLLPYFWQTWWFYGICSVAGICLVGGTARFVTRKKMQRKLERLEQQHAIEKERTRIARDMHDELGSRLTLISIMGASAKRKITQPAEVEKQIESMSATARELVTALDEIVWAVDPGNDTLDNLASYLCRYSAQFFQNTAIQCEFDIPAEVPAYHLTTDVRHNLFLAIKEALNNALKHSGATKMFIALLIHHDSFEVKIADDGKGFPGNTGEANTKRTKRTGNGLENMQQRLLAVKGSCIIESASGKGTEISFWVPMCP